MKTRRRVSAFVLLSLVGLLVWRVLSIDVADLRVAIPEEREPEPVNYAELEAQRQEDAERRLRNRTPSFVAGEWQVEATVDHNAKWKRQLELLEPGECAASATVPR